MITNLIINRLIPRGGQAEDSSVRARCGLVSGLIGILLNLLLCTGKFVAGAVTGSIAVMADAFNNLSDAGSSVVTLAGFRIAGQKPDDDHPFGHGRMEYLAGLVVSMLIILVGFELGKSSVEKIIHPEPVSFSLLSAVILGVSVLVKLWMCLFNRKLSKRISSAALAATATDSLSDAVATLVLLLGLLCGYFFHLSLDGWLGVAVSLFILRSGLGAAKDTLDPLLGQPPDPALVRGVQETVLSHKEVIGIHDLIIHDYGPGRRMLSLHAEVPLNADMMAVHDVIDHIERELKQTYGVDAVIHMDPIALGDPETDALRMLTARRVKEIDPDITIHDFRITRGPLHTNLIFDAVVPRSCPLTEEQLKKRIAALMKQENPNYFTVVEIDRAYVL